MDKNNFAAGMYMLFTAFPDFQPLPASGERPGTIDVYYIGLSDIDEETWKVTALKVLTEWKADYGKKFPDVATLREYAASLRMPARRSAMEAWGELYHATLHHGHTLYASPELPKSRPRFDDPALERFVARYGWNNLCMDEEPMVLRAHFLKSYTMIQDNLHGEAREFPAVTEARVRLLVGDLAKKLSAPNGDKR